MSIFSGKPPNYCFYILRCWQEHAPAEGADLLRFSLEDPQTGERHGFVGLEALMQFLELRMHDPIQGDQAVEQAGHSQSQNQTGHDED